MYTVTVGAGLAPARKTARVTTRMIPGGCIPGGCKTRPYGDGQLFIGTI